MPFMMTLYQWGILLFSRVPLPATPSSLSQTLNVLLNCSAALNLAGGVNSGTTGIYGHRQLFQTNRECPRTLLHTVDDNCD